ncbi:MAG: ammonium transporter [Gemmatimonadetes bacterium]|nr:ammonium transporter [Gemmatimonadota bacterium]
MPGTLLVGRMRKGFAPLRQRLDACLFALALAALFLLLSPDLVAAQEEAVISGGDTAWLLTSTALVLLMTAGLAFFYGGLVRSKNVLNTMMMSFIAFGFAGVLWVVVGYSLAFGEGGALVGDLSMAFLKGVGVQPNGTIPDMLFMAFQATFAIITAALISGAVVGRMRFGAYVAFISLWGLLVYAPVAHWVWGGGWLAGLGALDFAGGTVVHVNAGAAALTAALVLGPRTDYGRQAMLPHNVPFVLLGAGLLWFGWMGFNGGSALAADEFAALGVVNTLVAPCATLVVWALLDTFFAKQITAVGTATAIVVGLVAVTPAAGFVSPMSALAIGAIAALPSYGIIRWRAGTRLDDSLDVFAAHGVGGATGAILTGVFASAVVNGSADGLLFGNPGQVGIQAVAVLAVAAYSAVATLVILKMIQLVTPLRPAADSERRGMDVLSHGEEGYARGEGAVLILHEELNGSGDALRHPAIARELGEPRTFEGSDGTLVRLVKAIVRPDKLSDVLNALYMAEVTGFTVSRVQGHGGETETVETYRGTSVKMGLTDKVMIDIGVSEPFVEATVEAVLSAARTGDVGDGKVFVLPVQAVHRIRTAERDTAAVTPVAP